MPLTSTLRVPCVPRITQRVATLLPSASSSSSVKFRSGNALRSAATSVRKSAMPLTTIGGLRKTTSAATIASIAAALPLLRISSKYRRAIALLSARAGAWAAAIAGINQNKSTAERALLLNTSPLQLSTADCDYRLPTADYLAHRQSHAQPDEQCARRALQQQPRRMARAQTPAHGRRRPDQYQAP